MRQSEGSVSSKFLLCRSDLLVAPQFHRDPAAILVSSVSFVVMLAKIFGGSDCFGGD